MHPLTAFCMIAVTFFFAIVAVDVNEIEKELVRIANALEEGNKQTVYDDSFIDCPVCSTDNSLYEIVWRKEQPDIGDCSNCHIAWQNLNTRDEPHLKVVRLP